MSDDDFDFEDLLDEAVEATRGGEEVISWEAPAVNRVAHILAEGSKNVSDADPYTNMLMGHLVREGRSGLDRELNGVSQEDRVKILLASEALAPHRIDPQVDGVSSFEDYMDAVGAAFGERLGRLLNLDMEFKGVEREEVGVAVDDIVVDPLFTGFRPETLIAANVVSNLVGDVDVGSYDALARSAFLKFNGTKGTGVDDVTRVLVERGLKQTDIDLDVGTAVGRYQEILVSRFGFTQDLITQLDELEGRTFDFDDMAVRIREKFEERTGYVPNIGTGYGQRDYENLRATLLDLSVKLFKPLPTEPTPRFHVRDWARPYQALGRDGKKYSRRARFDLKRLPLGTVGKLDGDRDFVPTHMRSYTTLDFKEMQKLEEVLFGVAGTGGEFRRGDDVEIVQNLGPNKGYPINEYYYNGTVETIPLQTKGTVTENIRTNKIRVEFPQRNWVCHPDELKNLTRPVEVEEEEKDEREELKIVMAEIVDQAEGDFKKAKENREKLVREGVETFRAMGVDDGIINHFFKRYVDVSEFEDVIPEDNIFTSIRGIQGSMNYEGLRDKVVDLVNDGMEVIIQVNRVQGVEDYVRFKREIVERVLNGFKLEPDRERRGFREGDPVMLTERWDDYPNGTVAFYRAPCGRGHHLDFDDRRNRHVDATFVNLAKAYDNPDEVVREEITAQLGPIIAEAESDHAEANRRLDDLTMRTIDTFRSMGFEDSEIGTMFRENLRSTSYLQERGLLGE